ncbi:MAG: hypothetical protein H7338_04315 [Candidatus Sericytochromatia bacterium]|nr:hypothetical protein [Candidatus Sericytochromatia bacterium]
MSTTDGIGPGEEGTVQDQPETSEIGWDLEMGHIDDVGEGDEDLTDMIGEPNPGPASLGDRNDPIEQYIDDWPGEEAA